LTTGRQLASLLLMASETCRKHVIVTLSSLHIASHVTEHFLDRAIQEIRERGCKLCIILTGVQKFEKEANNIGLRYTLPILYWSAPREHYIVVDLLPLHVASGQADMKTLRKFLLDVVQLRKSLRNLLNTLNTSLDEAYRTLSKISSIPDIVEVQTATLKARHAYLNAYFSILNLGPFRENIFEKLVNAEIRVVDVYRKLLELDTAVTERRFGISACTDLSSYINAVLTAHEDVKIALNSCAEYVYNTVSSEEYYHKITRDLECIVDELSLLER